MTSLTRKPPAGLDTLLRLLDTTHRKLECRTSRPHLRSPTRAIRGKNTLWQLIPIYRGRRLERSWLTCARSARALRRRATRSCTSKTTESIVTSWKRRVDELMNLFSNGSRNPEQGSRLVTEIQSGIEQVTNSKSADALRAAQVDTVALLDAMRGEVPGGPTAVRP
jgi:hypothetical protein